MYADDQSRISKNKKTVYKVYKFWGNSAVSSLFSKYKSIKIPVAIA